MAPAINDKLTIGSRVTIAQDADLRGEMSIGSGTVIHPRATVYALHGPITIGSDCIIEETATIVNRRTEAMHVGDDNLFEVGCRIEAATIGSSNVFSVRCRVASSIRVGSFCTIGAGCNVIPTALWPRNIDDLLSDDARDGEGHEGNAEKRGGTSLPGALGDAPSGTTGTATLDKEVGRRNEPVDAACELLPDRTVVFGQGATRRLWSGEGVTQEAALHAKHLEYLRDVIPKAHPLKIIRGVRAASPTKAGP